MPTAAAGLLLSTYTGALLARRAPRPARGQRELPALFAGGAAASAGAAAAALTPVSDAGPARRLTLIGTAGQAISILAMRRRLGRVGRGP